MFSMYSYWREITNILSEKFRIFNQHIEEHELVTHCDGPAARQQPTLVDPTLQIKKATVSSLI